MAKELKFTAISREETERKKKEKGRERGSHGHKLQATMGAIAASRGQSSDW